MCVDANAGLRAQQKQRWREKNSTYAQQGLKFFNKETSLRRAKDRNIIGYGRDLSDQYVKALYTQGKGRLAVQNAAAKYFASKSRGKSLQGGRALSAGRNSYLKYLNTVAKVDSVMDATFGRNMAYAQEGARRKYLNKNARAREALGIPASYGAPVMQSGTDYFSGFLNLASQVVGIASGGISIHDTLTGSDIRLKENVEQVGVSPQGYKIYEFNYKDDFTNTRYRGAMAQDVVKKNPMAVDIRDNYLAVDYSQIDVDMEVV